MNSFSVDSFNLSETEELDSLLPKWNNTDVDYEKFHNLCELFERHVKNAPDSTALIYQDKIITYQELSNRVNGLAYHLRRNGAGADVTIGILAERSIELIIGILAILKAGAAYLPLDPAYPLERLSYMIGDASPSILLLQSKYVENARSVCPTEISFVILDDSYPVCPEQPCHLENISLNTAYIIYTSGSTGNPKGIQVSHGTLIDRMQSLSDIYKLSNSDVFLFYGSCSFDAAIEEYILPLTVGACIVIFDSDLQIIPENLVKKMIEHKVTIFNSVPALLDMVLDEVSDVSKMRIRLLTIGGEPLFEKSANKFRKLYQDHSEVQLYNLYGPTEAAIDSTFFKYDRQKTSDNGNAIVPIGRPIPNTKIYILDNDLNKVPVGVVGEIYIEGSGLARGYLGKADLTAEKFIANPFGAGNRLYKSGDLGKYLPDGNIDYIGRVDDQVKVRGHRVELREIESVICSSSQVKTTAVIVKNIDSNLFLLAYIVPFEVESEKADYVIVSDCDEKIRSFSDKKSKRLVEEIRTELEKSLPDYLIPNYFFVVDRIPIGVSGKLDKQSLLKFDFSQAVFVDDYVPPSNEIEEKLCDIWQKSLGLNKVSVNDNFFKIGGDSIIAIQVSSKARNMGISFSVKDLFEHQTIRKLSKVIKELPKHEPMNRQSSNENFFDGIDEEKIRALLMENKNLEAVYPLTYIQAGMLFQDLYSNSDSYFIQEIMSFYNFDVDLFKRSCAIVINKYEVTRSYVLWEGFEEGKLFVQKQVEIPFLELDFSGVAEDKKELKLKEYLENDRRNGFNLSSAPLLRFCIIKFSEDHIVVVWSFHHIVLDGWSYSIIFEEIIKTYNALFENTALEITKADEYKTYIDFLKNEDIEKSNDFWKNYLKDSLPTIFNFKRIIKNGSNDYGECFLSFSERESANLREVSNKFGVTISTLICGGLGILISRYLRQDDVIIGMTFSGRSIDVPNIENMVGMFLNTLPVRIKQLTCEKTKDYFHDLQINVQAVGEHGNVPLYKIQKMVEVDENPLFSVLFVYENYPINENLFQNSRIQKRNGSFGIEKTEYPLTVEASSVDGQISVRFSYKKLCFDEELIEGVKDSLKTILLSLNEAEYVQDIRMFVDDNRLRCRRESEIEYECVLDLFEEQVRKNRSQIAVSFGDTLLTYEELNKKVNQFAHYLKKQGVTQESLVAIYIGQSVEMIIGILSVMKAGAAYVPIDIKAPTDRIKIITEEVPFLLTSKNFSKNLVQLKTTKIFCIDSPTWNAESTENPQRSINSLNLAYVIYTSGSTGIPKGVSITHGNLSNYVQWGAKQYDLSKGRICILHASIAFDMSVTCIFVPMVTGMEICILPDMLSLDAIGNKRLAILKLTPSHIKQMAEYDFERTYSVDSVIIGGESFTYKGLSLLKKKFDFDKSYNEYGPTEATVGCSYFEIDGSDYVEDYRGTVPIGYPIANSHVYILDDRMNPVPVGMIGEIYIGGNGVARGYLNRPDLTAEKFIADPFICGSRLYKTGDLGRYIPCGGMEYLGRIDNQVKIRGFRIEIDEIEMALSRCNDLIKSAIVLAVEDGSSKQKQLVSYIVPICEGEFSKVFSFKDMLGEEISVYGGEKAGQIIEEIIDKISLMLPDYMIPTHFLLIQKIPLGLSGKADAKLLRKLDVRKGLGASGYVAPRNEIEKCLCDIWQEVLHVDKIGINDNFFKVGGDSIIAIQVLSKSKMNGLIFSLKDIFEKKTISELSRSLHFEEINDGEIFEYIPPAFELTTMNKNLLEQQVGGRFLSDAYPASPLQKGLFFQSAYNDDDSYFVQHVNILENLDLEIFKEAWRVIVDKYDSLRMGFVLTEEGATACVLETAEMPFEYYDLRKFYSDSKLKDFVSKDREKLFDLSNPPLMRISLLHIDENKFAVVWSFHHIILDGWSSMIVFEKVLEVYEQLHSKKTVNAGNNYPYKDYITWLNYQDKKEAINFWKGYLKDIEQPTQLSFKTELNVSDGKGYKTTSFRLNDELVSDLITYGREKELTLSSICLGIFGIVVGEYLKQDEITIGTTISGRSIELDHVDEIVGLFINTVPVKIDLSGPGFVELFDQIQKIVQKLNENGYLSLSDLLKWSGLGRNLFNILFLFENYPTDEEIYRKSSIKITEIESVERTEYPLTVATYMKDNSLVFNFSYQTEHFDGKVIEEMFFRMKDLLAQLRKDPKSLNEIERELSPVKILSEKEQMLIEWNNTRAEYPCDKCIYELFEKQVEKTPDAVAVVYKDKHLKYGQLNTRSNQLANYLRKLGVSADSLVAICVDRSLEMVIGILGVLKAGGAYVPIDPTYPEGRLRYMLEDSGTKIVLTQRYLQEKLKNLFNNDITVICLDENEKISDQPMENLTRITSPQNLAYVMYTSGSTGKPKGVQVCQQGFINRVLWMENKYVLQQKDRVLQKTAISFDLSAWELFWPLFTGARLYLLPDELRLDPIGLFNFIKSHEITVINFVPSQMRAFVDVCDIRQLSNLRLIISGGEVLPRSLYNKVRDLTGISIQNGYGPTEVTLDATYFTEENKFEGETIPIGRPISNMQIYILDSKQQTVPLGVSGEIYIGGVGLARGYLNRPDLTAEKFVANPFGNGNRLYRTGDLGRYLPDGNIEFLGRFDNQVKIRGFRIELGEIESVISEDNKITSSVVLAKEMINGIKRLVAYLVPNDVSKMKKLYDFESQQRDIVSVFGGEDSKKLINRVRRSISGKLPDYMMPSFFVILDKVPLTPNGKTDIKLLLTLSVGNSSMGDTSTMQISEIEKQLCKIWGKVLHINQVGINDNFFEIGGDSIATLSIFQEYKIERFPISIKEIFDCPTISQQAEIIKCNIIFGSYKEKEKLFLKLEAFPAYITFNDNQDETVFIFPPGEGHAESYIPNIIRNVEDKRIVAFNNLRLFMRDNLGEDRDLTFEKLAAFCIEKIKDFLLTDNYVFVGWSFGGILAFEIARQMLEFESFKSKFDLILIDPFFGWKEVLSIIGSLDKDYLEDMMYNYDEKIPDKFADRVKIQLIKSTLIDETTIVPHQYYVKQTSDNNLQAVAPSECVTIKKIVSSHEKWIKNPIVVEEVSDIIRSTFRNIKKI